MARYTDYADLQDASPLPLRMTSAACWSRG
jgi:hypothetical protein